MGYLNRGAVDRYFLFTASIESRLIKHLTVNG